MSKECGTCTRCCDGTLAGDVRGHAMYPGKPCFFLEIGGACGDYENRPHSPCKEYKCLWLTYEEVPDYIKPENANAILDLEQHKGKWYLRLNKTETPYLADVLAYGINFAQQNNLSFIWTDNQGNFGYLGDREFCYDIVSTNANMYNDFIKKEKR
jgi:uncharacterized cysteine cluster protein YcgN (CxxCxxCC family)